MKTQIQNKIFALCMIALLITPFSFTHARNENPGTDFDNGNAGSEISGGGNTTAGTGGSDTTGGNETSGEGNPTSGSGSENAGGSGPGGEPLFSNNQSFPVIAADGFGITAVANTTFTTAYEGPYTGLSAEELLLVQNDDWYAQKTEGNVWQADYNINPSGSTLAVYGVDWGDIIESVNPVIGRPFRLELTMYTQPEELMDGYTMELLAFPSSLDEIQGTNAETYESEYATVVSTKPKMVIQSVGDIDPLNLTWTEDGWTAGSGLLPVTEMVFGSELNVGGKYIFGGSKGGWRPVETGLYRITFNLPDSDLSLADAVIGNYADWIAEDALIEGEDDKETSAATPVIDSDNNITYVDVTVITQREGRKPENPGEDEEDTTHEEDAALTTSTTVNLDGTAVTSMICEPYLTDYQGINLDNNPLQVVLLQEFLNETLGTNIPLTGYFGEITLDAVKLFQTTYASDILAPWVVAGHYDVSLAEGTGYVGVTTLEKINELACTA